LFRRRRSNLQNEMRLTPEGWVFLVVLAFITVGAVLRNVNLLVIMAGMMFAPLLLNWRIGNRWFRSLLASRRIPTQLHANELATIQWKCENQMAGMAAWSLAVNDRITRLENRSRPVAQLEDSGGDTESSARSGRRFRGLLRRFGRRTPDPNCSEVKVGFVRVGAGQAEVQSYRVFFSQRGQYEVGPAALSTTFPFGLVVSRIHFREIETIFVGPEIGQLHPSWERRVQSIASGSDTIKRRRALEEDEFYALRPWRSGDCKRNIHWRTSAKYGQPIVKQHDQQNNRDFALMLDLALMTDDDGKSESDVETALSFAGTAILQIGNDVQGQIAIGVCGEKNDLYHSRSHRGVVLETMEHLAIAQPREEPDIVEMLIQISNSVSSGTPIYVISSRPRPLTLDPYRLDTNTGNREADRLAKRLKQVLPLIRWLEVGSDEFGSMFSLTNDPSQDKLLQRFSSRWSSDVKR